MRQEQHRGTEITVDDLSAIVRTLESSDERLHATTVARHAGVRVRKSVPAQAFRFLTIRSRRVLDARAHCELGRHDGATETADYQLVVAEVVRRGHDHRGSASAVAAALF